MINIPNFDKDYVGRQFKSHMGTVFTIVGYGDNNSNGNPYLVGVTNDSNGQTIIRTVLFKDVVFVSPSATWKL